MPASFLQIVISLVTGIALIALLTAKYKVHAFFALFIACLIVGFGVQMPVADTINAIKDGFGNIMKSLGLIITLGTTLGLVMQHTGSTHVMATWVLKRTGKKNAALAMSITGFIVGLPIFCDSGYMVLSSLPRSLAKTTGISRAVMSVALATGLYSVHCLIPPHPGAAAAAGTIGVDFGRLIIMGIIVALPAMLAGYMWAVYAGKNANVIEDEDVPEDYAPAKQPVIKAFMPVVVPIALIAIKSFFSIDKNVAGGVVSVFAVLGDPVIALSIGVLLAFMAGGGWKKETVSKLLGESAEKAAGVLVIIGAGGAFGAVLAATKVGQHFSEVMPLGSIGLLFPFLLTFILKTAQGSSTVAIITAASIVQPLLGALGLESENGKLLCVLAMGAGSFVISHANDGYFWAIAKFSNLDMKTMLKVYSAASIFMGLTALAAVYILSFILK